jgi:hypothetical protein
MPRHVSMSAPVPPLENGYTRVDYIDISAETEKAYLIQLEDKSCWIPKSQCKLHLATYHIDIADWFYEKFIEA